MSHCAPWSAILFSPALLNTACEKTGLISSLPLVNNSKWLRSENVLTRLTATVTDKVQTPAFCRFRWQSTPSSEVTLLFVLFFYTESFVVCLFFFSFFTRQNRKSIHSNNWGRDGLRGELFINQSSQITSKRQSHAALKTKDRLKKKKEKRKRSVFLLGPVSV